MSALVHLRPYEYEATLVSKASPEIIRCSGTVYASNDEQAVEEVERQYQSAKVGVLQSIKVTPRWPQPGEGNGFTRYINSRSNSVVHTTEEDKEPEWEFWRTEGLQFWMGAEPDTKPFPKEGA